MIEPGQAVAIVAEVADALDTAHRSGVIHRDIKPANILLSTDGRVLVADFGIAKAGEDLTATNTTLGTAKYLAPEQIEGGPVDARTDVYSLGIVLYEVLCGRPPFVADTDAATALARLRGEPMRPRNVRAGIPKPLEDVVMRAIARRSRGPIPDRGRVPRRAARGGPRQSVGAGRARGRRTAAISPRRSPSAVPAIDPTPAGAPPPAFVRTERGWLVPTIVIVLAAVALILAGVLVTKKATDTDRRRRPPAPSAAAVQIQQASAFDPPPGNGQENNADAAKTIDGNPSTLWQTEGYNSRSFGNLKPGVGLVLTLEPAGRPQHVDHHVADQRLGGRDLRQRRSAAGSQRVG